MVGQSPHGQRVRKQATQVAPDGDDDPALKNVIEVQEVFWYASGRPWHRRHHVARGTSHPPGAHLA
jgi:hypothetical protein